MVDEENRGDEQAGAPPHPATKPKKPKKPRNRRRQLIEWAIVILAAGLTAVVLRAEVVQAFEIPSESMYPTLRIGDRVLVNKLGYRLHDVHRGDIVVFTRPPEPDQDAQPPAEPQIKDLIKRVVGLPGDTVSTRDGKVLINGKVLDEPYLPAGTRSEMTGEAKVPAGRLWVMGDNRAQSKDSRYFGTIKESSVIGRAFVRMWPVSHWGGL